ncbi:MAG: aminoglycoside 6-adenylyltransferase, partial [Theionarchaea archaeon]|nr:aminoglycoside 6-adenylyltransferase [Theionarchaea archaeon]
PTEQEFHEVISDFLYHCIWTAKHLRRGELWWAKECCDSHLKGLLLTMVEWHSRALQGSNYDTWFRGRFLETWADPRVLKGLKDAFAYYDEKDVKRALDATMELFRWLARETGEKLEYSYLDEADEKVTSWVRTCLSI